MSAETAIQGQLDRIAAGRQSSLTNFAVGGGDFWTRVDAAANELYENRVKGSDITALDTALSAGSIWSVAALKKWFELHINYITYDLLLAYPQLDSFLASVGWRVPYEAAESHYDAMGYRISSQYIFPKGIRTADESDPATDGMHEFGSWNSTTFTSVDGALATAVKGAPVLIISDAGSITGTLVALATLQDATTKQIAFTQDATEHGQVILGQAALGTGGASPASKTMAVKTSIAQFKAAEYVLLEKADKSKQEVIQIDSVGTLELTMETDPINTYLEDDLVLPMFTNVARQSGTAGAAILFYARPDRVIAL